MLLHHSDLQRLSTQPLSSDQLNFGFVAPALIPSGLRDLDEGERVRLEMDHLGMDVSHHLLEFYANFLNQIGAVRSTDLLAQRSGASVLVAGIKVGLQSSRAHLGKKSIVLTLDDGYGCNDATFFIDLQQKYSDVLFTSWLFLVQGEVRRTGPRGVSLRATGAWISAMLTKDTLSRQVLS